VQINKIVSKYNLMQQNIKQLRKASRKEEFSFMGLVLVWWNAMSQISKYMMDTTMFMLTHTLCPITKKPL